MAVLKAPLKQPKTTVVQLRLDDEAKMNLAKYAEFLDCSPSYVVTEVLKLVCITDMVSFRPGFQAITSVITNQSRKENRSNWN